MHKKLTILFLLPYPYRCAASQRFRVEQFIPYLQADSFSYRVHTFLDEKVWNILYQKGRLWEKAVGVLKGFISRLFIVLFVAPRYDYVFIHREAAPLGPPVFEFILTKLLRKKIIYDFDDAIWIADLTTDNRFPYRLKAPWKVRFICSWAHRVAVGNNYLAEYAKQYANDVVVLPTCVDTKLHHNRVKEQNTSKVVVGWTGSHSTMKYLDALTVLLSKLAHEKKVDILVISNSRPLIPLPNLHFKLWKEETEINDLLNLNIGLMPLEEDAWSEGKCGFKLIQYLSLGIPAIASPVGVNTIIIEDGVNGFLCNTTKEWENALNLLIENAELRRDMGQKGREKIIAIYSVEAHSGNFIALFS